MQKRYPKTEYKRYFCVPACIKSILSSRGIGKEIDLWTIGRELDLKVPKKFSNNYPNTKTSPNKNFEINLHKEEFSLNNFFKRYNLPLNENYVYRTNKNKILELFKKYQSSDILVCFDCPTIANIQNKRWGHVSLITDFDEKHVFIQDPKSIENIKISYGVILKAIKVHSKKRRGGFWIISETACAK